MCWKEKDKQAVSNINLLSSSSVKLYSPHPAGYKIEKSGFLPALET